MLKKKMMFLALMIYFISACSNLDFTLPKGDKGDPGIQGMSAYESWVELVESGTYPEWKDHTEATDFMKFLSGKDGKDGIDGSNGVNGASAYDTWKDMIASGKVKNPHRPGEMWDATKNSKENFYEFLTGGKGETGLPGSKVTINKDGNWEIDGVDTNKPAIGKNGLSAYEIWKKRVMDNLMPDKNDPSKMWDSSKSSLSDFWEYFAGRSGADGTNGKNGFTPEIIEGFWHIGGVNTGVPAVGKDGSNGTNGTSTVITIGDNNNWFINGEDTGKPAIGKDGTNGTNGTDGTSTVITIGDNNNWFINGEDTGKPAIGKDGTNGTNGTDGTSTVITIGDNNNWFINGEDTGVPAIGKDGTNGTNGTDGTSTVITIGDNNNWFINGEDTGKPAVGKDGTNGIAGMSPEITIGDNGNWEIDGKDTGKPSVGKGTPGKTAYQIWIDEVMKGNLKNPHPTATGYEGEFWPTSKTALVDFWYFLRGRDGVDGQDGKDGQDGSTEEIVKGKPNVIVQYFNSKDKEYIYPKDGSAHFLVFDKEGELAPEGSTVQGLPGIDESLVFTVDDHGAIYVPHNVLPNKESLAVRKGATQSVTINGNTMKSAENTIVPNRVNTRLTLKDVYLRPNSPWDWNRTTSVNDFLVIKYAYEREIDGVWSEAETYIHNNDLAILHIKDVNKALTQDNFVENIDQLIANPSSYQKWGSRRGVGGSPGNNSTPFFDINDGIFLVYRPIVLTEDEKKYDVSQGTRYDGDYRMDWLIEQLETCRKYQWKGTKDYITLVGLTNYYGQHPILDAKVHNPEVYPTPLLKDVKYEIMDGKSSLRGRFDEATFYPFYKEFVHDTATNVWNGVKKERVGAGEGPGFQISMTKFTEDESGSTELKSRATLDDLSFSLGSAYEDNVLTTRVFSYWGLPEPGRLGECNSFYRIRPIYDFYNIGTSRNPIFILKDIYGTEDHKVSTIHL